jgi:hypothetical protein
MAVKILQIEDSLNRCLTFCRGIGSLTTQAVPCFFSGTVELSVILIFKSLSSSVAIRRHALAFRKGKAYFEPCFSLPTLPLLHSTSLTITRTHRTPEYRKYSSIVHRSFTFDKKNISWRSTTMERYRVTFTDPVGIAKRLLLVHSPSAPLRDLSAKVWERLNLSELGIGKTQLCFTLGSPDGPLLFEGDALEYLIPDAEHEELHATVSPVAGSVSIPRR